jgi:hypothetical protein
MRGIAIALLGLCLPLGAPAHAAASLAGDNNHNGNGWNNHNAFSIRSPTRNEGIQPVSNANAGGVTHTRNAFCKKVRFCRIGQHGFTGFG